MSWGTVARDPIVIAGWTLDIVRLPYARRVTWSDTREQSATMALLRLRDRDGAEGAAEATVKPTWAGVAPQLLQAAVAELLMPLLSGRDIADPVALRAILGAVPENTLAKGLVDNAVWDLRAARAGRPLWRLWGGAGSAALSWAVTLQAPAAMAEEATRMVASHGFATLKLKGGQGVANDVAAARAIRSAAGDGIALYVDANWAYSAAATPDYCARMAEAGASHVEDPYRMLPDRTFERIAAASPVPVIVDFPCSSPEMAALFLERGARALSVKPARTGATAAWRIAELAAAAGAEAHVGLFGESDAGSVGSLALAASLPARRVGLPAETSVFLMLGARLLRDELRLEDGRVALPGTPSLHALIDWDALDRWRGTGAVRLANSGEV